MSCPAVSVRSSRKPMITESEVVGDRASQADTHVNNGQVRVELFRRRISQMTALLTRHTPRGTVDFQSIDVHAFARWLSDFLLGGHLHHIVGEHDVVQRPALVATRDLLSHSGEKTLDEIANELFAFSGGRVGLT